MDGGNDTADLLMQSIGGLVGKDSRGGKGIMELLRCRDGGCWYADRWGARRREQFCGEASA